MTNRFLATLSYILFFIFYSFAQQTVGVFKNTSQAFEGYTLIAPLDSKFTYLIDNCGRKIHSWESDYPPGASTYLLENGNLLRTLSIPNDFEFPGFGGGIELRSWDNELLWRYNYVSESYCLHHDVAYLPNGNILILALDIVSAEEARQKGRIDSLLIRDFLWSEKILEIKPLGENDAELVWEWRLWDHLVQEVDSSLENYGRIEDHPERININYTNGKMGLVDWLHMNSLNYNPALDQIILTSRHFNELYVIDHSSTTKEAASKKGGRSGKGGDILYRWGNPQAYNRGSQKDLKLFYPHDAHWILGDNLVDEGKIMIFNNGNTRPEGEYSSVEIIEPPINAAGQYQLSPSGTFGPKEFYWSYKGDTFFSEHVSNAQRLPNGNTLICAGAIGKLFEIGLDEQIHWEYMNPIDKPGPIVQGVRPTSNIIFRAYRYAPDYPAFRGKTLKPDLPLEINPLYADCTLSTELWSSTPLNGVSILENSLDDYLMIENANLEELSMQIFNAKGVLVETQKIPQGRKQISKETWKKGIYFLQLTDPEKEQYTVNRILKQ